MPRKSAAALLTLVNPDRPPRLVPPDDLTAAERKLFNEITTAVDPRHFVPSDMPLLVNFVRATALADRTANRPEQLEVWEKAVRLQAMLATRLRLAPQSRMSPRTAARRQFGYTGKKSWELDQET